MERDRHGNETKHEIVKEMRNFYVYLCWDQCKELDVPWKLNLKMHSSKKTNSMFFFGGGRGPGEMGGACHGNGNSKLQKIRKHI